MRLPIAPLLLALPWLAAPIVTLLRVRRSRSLDEESADAGPSAPLLSVIIPARNEAHNIRRCAESVLTSSYPRLELIVADDHSTDATGDVARELAARDARLHVVNAPDLPTGWFGKQWACHTGATHARGEILAFFDADTWQTPDLLPRAINAMRSRGSDLLTVGGTQELGSFWERLVQPQVFAVLAARYGGTESVNESPHATQKIANGQCLIVKRDVYEAIGGHASVRAKVAEDLALAQRVFVAGRRVTVVLGLHQLHTRMYTSLRELVRGWGKNLYAGGRDAMFGGAVGRALYPLALLAPGLTGVVPPVLLALSLAGLLGHGVLVWSAIVTSVNLLWWLLVYGWLGLSPGYALLHPAGAAVLLYISLRAIRRGSRVHWKGRDYMSG